MKNVMLSTTGLAKMIKLNNKLLWLAILLLSFIFSNAQTSYTWKAVSTNADWATTTNWTPAGTPVAGDHVVIVASNNIPFYNGVALGNFTLTSGAIDLGGNTLTINGNAVFTAGNVNNGNVLCQGTATTFTNATFSGKVTSITSNVLINGGVFNDSVSITKNGATDQTMNGNATFNGPLNLRITNNGRIWINGGMTLNGVTSIYNSGLDNFILDRLSANNYNNDLHFTIAGNNNGDINIGFAVPTTINGDVYVNSISGTGDVWFATGVSSSVTLGAGKRLYIGSDGFNSGNLRLQRFIQSDATAQSLTLTGTANLHLGPSSSFGGKVTFESPQIMLSGATFGDSAIITKTGVTTNTGLGSNVFNGVAVINKTGTGILRTNGGNTFNDKLIINNSSTTEIALAFVSGDTHNGDVVINKTAAGTVRMAYAGANIFGGDVTVSNSATGNVLFGELANSSTSISGDVTLTNTSTGSITFCSGANTSVAFGGNLILNNTSTGSLSFCSNATSAATMAAGKTISVGVSGFTGGSLLLPRFTQSGTESTNLTFTGATAAITIGPNTTFGGKVTLSAPQVLLSGATFSDSATITKTGATTNTGLGNNIFNGVAIFSKTAAGTGIWNTNGNNKFNDKLFINNASSSEINLALVSADSCFSNVVINNTLTGSVRMAYAGSNYFGGDVTVNKSSSGAVLFCELANSRATIAGNVTLTNSASGGITLCSGSNSSASIAGDVTLYNTSTGTHTFCSGANTSVAFGGNLILNNTSTGSLSFCSNATSSATMAAGKAVSIGGSGFTGGSLLLPRFTQSGTEAINLTLTGATAAITVGPGTVFGGKVTLIAPQVYLNGATFPDTTLIQKTGVTNNTGTGNNIFNGFTTITKTSGAGAGVLYSNGNNVFNNKLILNNASSSDLLFGLVSRDTYNDNVTINKTSTGSVRMAYAGANIFADTVTVNNTASGNVLFCELANSSAAFGESIIVSNTSTGAISFCPGSNTSATLAAGKTISVGALGFSGGSLLLPRFTQAGTAAINLTFTGATAAITVGPVTSFGGKVTLVAPQITLNGATFTDTTFIQKTGATDNTGLGSNVFNGFTTISKSSTATGMLRTNGGNIFNNKLFVQNASTTELLLNLLNGDTYNDDVTITRTGTGSIRMAYIGTNTFGGNIYLNSSAAGTIFFGEAVTSSSTLAINKVIAPGTTGLTAGGLSINRFTKSGTDPVVFTLGPNYNFTFGPTNSFIGDVTVNLSGTGTITVASGSFFGAKTRFIAPQVLLNGGTFTDSAYIEKTGATANLGAGGNKFLGVASIINSSAAALHTGNTTADSFFNKLNLVNSGSSVIYLAHAHSNQTSYFADSVIITNSSVAAAGSPGVRFGESNNTNAVFNSAVVVNNSGTGATNLVRFQNGTGTFTFNGDVHLNNPGTGATSAIHMNTTGTANYNNNIHLSRASGNGTYFGSNNGSATLAPNKNLQLAPSGYTAGNLLLRNFIQTGNRSTQNLTLTGTTIATIRNSTFEGLVSITAPQVIVNDNIFNHDATFVKTGTTDNISTGGNTFNLTTNIINNSTAAFRLANVTSDTYNGNVTFTRNGSGVLDPANNSEVFFSRNVTTAGSGVVTFGSGGASGRVTFTDGNNQTFNGAPSLIPAVSRMTMNKTIGSVLSLNTPLNISSNGNLTMTSGVINTDSINVITLLNNASSNLGSATAFVNGFMNYQMAASATRTLNFPIGRDSVYRPVELTVAHNAATNYSYSAQLSNWSAVHLGKALPPTIDRVSDLRFYQIHRYLTGTMAKSNANLSGNQTITLHYFTSDSVQDAANLRIVKDSAGIGMWRDIGGVGTADYNGTITSTSNPSAFNSFSNFALGNGTGGGNTLPVTLTDIKATAVDKIIKVEWTTATEINNKGFEVERSEDGINFSIIGWVDGNGTTTETINYVYDDKKADANKTYYYRLHQIDFDGASEHTPIVSAKITDTKTREIVWSKFIPNPVAADANLVINSAAEGKAAITILDLSGAVVHQSAFNLYNGLNNLSLDLSQLPSGNYITQIDLNGTRNTLKLMKE